MSQDGEVEVIEVDACISNIEPSLNETCGGRSGDRDFYKDGRKLTLTEMRITVGGACVGKWGVIKILVLDIDTYFFPTGHQGCDVE